MTSLSSHCNEVVSSEWRLVRQHQEPIRSEAHNEPKFSEESDIDGLRIGLQALRSVALPLPCSPAPTQRDEASFQLVLGRRRVHVDHHRPCGAIEG